MKVDLKARSHWLMGYAPPRATLKLLALRGDPFAQLVIDSKHPENAYRLVEQIRRRGRMSPVFWYGWVTADAQLVREVLRDGRFRTVKPRDRSPFRVVQLGIAKTAPAVMNTVEPPSLLVIDPPEHERLRRLVARAFTPRAIDRLGPRIRIIVTALLDDLSKNSSCDLIESYGSQIPLRVIAEMLGVPRDEIPQLYAFADPVTKLLTTTAPSWRDYRIAISALGEFENYIATHIERLRVSGDDSSVFAAVLQDGELTDIEVRTFAALLLGAGFVTTTHAFGGAVVALVGQRDQLEHLQDHPEGWANAVEEVLRYSSVVPIVARVATETLEIDGHTVRQGSPVFLLAGGANRDPAIFDRPNEFDVARANAHDHVGFGTGIHACLGAALARMELHIGLQMLFERFPHLALAGEPTLNDSTLLHGIKHLPVNLEPEPVTTG